MLIAGVDTNTKKIAIAILGKVNGPEIIEIEAKNNNWEKRFLSLYEQFRLFMENQKNLDAVFIEEPIMGHNSSGTIKLSHVAAACKIVCYEMHIDYFPVNVNAWKSGAVGLGNADKDSIRAMAGKVFGTAFTEGLSQDSIDALMIARWGQIRIGV